MIDLTNPALPGTSRRDGALTRLRPWIALAAATAAFALVPLGTLPMIYTVPVIGLLLAMGTPPDHRPGAAVVGPRRRNLLLGGLQTLLLALAVSKPQLLEPLVMAVGLELAGLVTSVIAVAALALPLAMTADRTTYARAAGPLTLTQRNLVLSATLGLSVATWYTDVGLSFVPIAALVLLLPVAVGLTRIVAARRGRLEHAWLRQPFRRGHRPHLLQLLNVGLTTALLALTLRTGAYDATVLELSARGGQIFRVCFVVALAALFLLMLIPLRRPRLGSNLLALTASVFLAAQLAGVYRPAAEPVSIGSPLAGEWYVGQGGHAELVNYHYVSSTQRDALDIMQAVDGRTHRRGSTALSDYYIFDQPILAPADGVVTYVLDGRPDLPIGSADRRYQAGNHVVIDIGGDRFLMMGHMREGSIRVAVGDRVRAGDVIARVGNSGNTTEPHIHIQVQSVPYGLGDIEEVDVDTLLRELRTYPLVVSDVVLTRGETESRPAGADPRRGDLVRPLG